MSSVILKPLVNEKSMALVKDGMYTFLIDRDATKELVAKVVKQKFSVDVLSVKTINVKPKTKQQRSRKGHFTTAAFKKAIVKVKKGQRIALFEEATKVEEDVTVTTAEGEKKAEVKEKRSLLKGTKVKIEKTDDKENVQNESNPRRSTKTSQKEAKKG